MIGIDAFWMRIAAAYDLPVVCVAIMMCALGALTATSLGRLALIAQRGRRCAWLALAVLGATGAIWSSAVLSILALRLPLPIVFDAPRFGVSFVAGLALVGVAAWITMEGRLSRMPVVGGALCGAAVVVIRELVMRSTRVAGTIQWDTVAVVAAVFVGIALVAPTAVLWRRGRSRNATGTVVLFVVATCSSHLLATYGATVVAREGTALPAYAIGSVHAAESIVLVAVLLAGLALVGQTMNRRDRIHRAMEHDHFRQLADVAVEGLVLCEGSGIVWANRSLEDLVPGVRASHVGRSLETLLEAHGLADLPVDREIEARLRTDGPDGTASLPVRIIKRAIQMSGRPHHVIAIRDQRERLHVEAEMARLANTDALTGLANRARFNALLDDFIARQPADHGAGGDFALLAFDLDGFKVVNDSHGHAAGDAVLVEVARRLTSLVRGGDLVARVGGDEFAIVIKADGADDVVAGLARRAIDAIARPFVVEGRFHQIGVSVGVARARRDGDDAQTLTRHADLALYSAKADGRGRFRFFEERMRVASQDRQLLAQALREAVVRDELRLHFQPQVDARTGRYDGAEALLRWMHPKSGLIQPSAFIDIAEETNLIVEIGAWVIRAACLEAARWPDALTVGVNLSPVQLTDPALVTVVASALAAAGLPGRRLEIEITESVLIADGTTVRTALDGLKALGIRLALDDFGMGYSSLGHLHRFPFDKIKIDRSFIARVPEEPSGAAIVRAVIALGAGLGMRTSAEGVETEAQRRFVVQAGCDQIQGFLISRPVAPSELPPAFSSDHSGTEPPWSRTVEPSESPPASTSGRPGSEPLRSRTVDRGKLAASPDIRRRADDALIAVQEVGVDGGDSP